MMNDSLLISEILKECFPVECETVGPTNLDDIVESEVSFTPAEYGSYLDLGIAIAILVAAVTFIKSVLEIYAILKKELGRDPQKDELEIRIIIQEEITQRLDKHTCDHLTMTVIRKLQQEKWGL